MQSYHVDASHNYYSLDDVYYFGGQQGNNVKAIQDHRGRNPGVLCTSLLLLLLLLLHKTYTVKDQ